METETADWFKMNYLTFVLINGPLVALDFVVNTFFMFCLVRERIKQPLKLLLLTLICCTIPYLMSVFVMTFSELQPENDTVTRSSHVLAICTLSTSMTSSVWLNFFYYTQIVPAQRALFIWIKKNVKLIIYCIWLLERIHSLFECTITFLIEVYIDEFTISSNSTMDPDRPFILMEFWKNELQRIYIVVLLTLKTYFIFCLCVMVMSSALTAVYLCRHMQRMVTNGRCLSCPQLRSQVRVTATGILQGVLYLLCAMWTMLHSFSYHNVSLNMHFTVINLYMLGTTFNLGAGQAVFRQRAADMWQRVATCYKATQAQQSEQG